MRYVVITACTNRKRVAAPVGLKAASLTPGSLASVAEAWLGRLRSATPAVKAEGLYAGRAFAEARRIANDGNLYIVSAGLGLVQAQAEVPAYGLTIAAGTADNVLARVIGPAAPVDWWRLGPARSPFNIDVLELAEQHPGVLILAALPSGYLLMVAADLTRLADRTDGRLRLFCAAPPADMPEALRMAVMPYDTRFDGPDSPLAGTLSDFAQRAMRHFVESVIPSASAGSTASHHTAVRDALANLRAPACITRGRASDSEIIELIASHWGRADGKSTRMLRLLRDQLGVACEQGRFVRLFQAAASRAVAVP